MVSSKRFGAFLGVLILASLATHDLQGAPISQAALRFFGTGVGPPGQQDRALFAVDDNAPGNASTSIDIGADSFTLELWLRGSLADNSTSSAGGDVELWDYSWIDGNILLDRDVWCGTERAYGVSLAGGFVRFGTGSGDGPIFDSANTIEGNVNVLDDQWHHVAVVRNATTGVKSLYVDGALDFASSAEASQADLSYPDGGIFVTPGQCGPGQLTPYGWYLVLAAEKHDAGAEFPSFNGFVDELRLWAVARDAVEIAASHDRRVPSSSPGLVADYRFEEGTGTVLGDSSAAGAPNGDLVAGTAGNGEWVTAAAAPSNTAPLVDGGFFADGFESGDTTAWTLTVP